MKPSLLLFASLIFILHDALAQNKKPTLSGPFSWEVNVGQQICITINTNDQDLGDSTFIYWTKDIPAAQWSDNNGTVKHASGYFCWTPTIDDASTLPYHFWACVTDKKDTTCAKYTVSILPDPNATRSFVNKGNGLWELTITPTSSFFTGASFKWYEPKPVGTGFSFNIFSDQPSTTYKFTHADIYLMKSSIYWKGDYTTYFDTLQVDSSFFPTGINQNKICAKITYESNNRIKVLCPGTMHARIFDLNGKEQMICESEDLLIINLGKLSAGMYLLQLETGGKVGGYKIIR
jgi:hypothetical protein